MDKTINASVKKTKREENSEIGWDGAIITTENKHAFALADENDEKCETIQRMK